MRNLIVTFETAVCFLFLLKLVELLNVSQFQLSRIDRSKNCLDFNLGQFSALLKILSSNTKVYLRLIK